MSYITLPRVSEQDTGSLRRVGQRERVARVSRATALSLGLLSIVLGAVAGVSIELYRTSRIQSPTRQPSRSGIPVAPVFTAPSLAGAAFSKQHASTDSMFAPYLAAHGGATELGSALAPALAVEGGWLQVFASGALFLPQASTADTPQASRRAPSADTSSALAQLVKAGSSDPTTGVIALPLLSALLAAGSEVAIGPGGSPLTYADLRAASDPTYRVAAPRWYRSNAPTGPAGTFIPEEVRNGVILGHMVPLGFWSAMNDPAMAPDGWAADFGRPLTEALIGKTTGTGAAQQVVVQLFEHDALVQTVPAAPAAGAPAATGAAAVVRRVPVGLDYLRTFGPPQPRNLAGTTTWATEAVVPRAQPDPSASPEIALGQNFPLTLQAGSIWVNGSLWYQARWQTPLRQGSGWVPAVSLTFHRPSGPATADFNALDPALASYLADIGSRVGVVVYDVTRGITYQYNPSGSFIVASSVKVPIMLALLTKLEAAGREPDADEMSLLTTMIENSNNDSAQALYEEIGDAPGLAAFMTQVGIGGLNPSPGTWGWSTITPQAMVDLLTLLQQGNILTSADRALALSLMEHVETDEQIGVGSTAPQGAITAMKDGWVTGPDGLWVVNSSGIVAVGSETYIIAVYTVDDEEVTDGWDITEHVSGTVAQLLA